MAKGEPYTRAEARKRIGFILKVGSVDIWRHCRDEQANDGIDDMSVTRALAFGMITEEAEEEHAGVWRYRVHKDDICVVVEFSGDTELAVVTCWRKR